jgi:RNA polymerase sigma factor (sigma-70 family)
MYASSPEQRRAAKARELAATLYSEHYAELRAAARGHCAKWADPEDALQEALAIFIASFDPDAGSPPLPWLRLTLKRLSWAATERRRMEARIGTAASGSAALERLAGATAAITADPAAAAMRAERVRTTREAMVQLPSEQRRTISLLAIGYSYGEIAERTDATPRQVDRRLQGARARLRDASR